MSYRLEHEQYSATLQVLILLILLLRLLDLLVLLLLHHLLALQKALAEFPTDIVLVSEEGDQVMRLLKIS